MAFEQITDAATEPLRPIAVVDLEPEDFTSHWGVEFEEGSDDLDFTRSALLALESGVLVGLVRCARAPQPGTELHAPESLTEPGTVRRTRSSDMGRV
ncbi:MAG: hypothetical protein ACRDLA_00925 [Thermoleophilaceae bacterium]